MLAAGTGRQPGIATPHFTPQGALVQIHPSQKVPERSSVRDFHHRMFHTRTCVKEMNTYTPHVCLFDNLMKTREWSPARRNQALGLVAGGRHSLHEITNITNIPKGTI